MKNIIITLSLLFISNITYSAPITFNFIFLEDGGTARTVGHVTYEDTLLSNPGDNFFALPDAAILDLRAVVTGTVGGDGVFTLSDFNGVAFSTGGLALDFSRELVGQPTDTSPWGTIFGGDKTTYQGQGGPGGHDFNLFGNAQLPPSKNTNTPKGPIASPPIGVAPYVLGAFSGEEMALVSFSAHIPVVVPTLSNSSLILVTLMLVLFGFYNIRRLKSS